LRRSKGMWIRFRTMATEVSKRMPNTPRQIRIELSAIALAICWFVYGIGFGLYLRDVQGSFLFFIWSVPFFAIGWILVGIPIIAMGNRILKIPRILLGIAGAIAAPLIILAFFIFVALLVNHGTLDFSKWSWSSAKGGPLFGFASANGASALVIYHWLLSRKANRAILSQSL